MHTKMEAAKALTKLSVDCWALNHLKMGFLSQLNSKSITGNLIPLSELTSYLKSFSHNLPPEAINILIEQVKLDDTTMSINSLNQLMELFTFIPIFIQWDKNQSTRMYQALTTGTQV